jgi:hypothetical protein
MRLKIMFYVTSSLFLSRIGLTYKFETNERQYELCKLLVEEREILVSLCVGLRRGYDRKCLEEKIEKETRKMRNDSHQEPFLYILGNSAHRLIS